MERVGFKEWALVCLALGDGRQCVLIRKGGIAEGRDGFRFRHREFFFFPTFFHEQVERTRLTKPKLPEQLPNEIEVCYYAKVEETLMLAEWEKVQALEPLHILQESVVRERFDYDDAPGVQLAFVRIFLLEPAWRFENLPRYGGCRSWVDLPEIADSLELRPVLSEEEHRSRRDLFRRVVSG